MNNRFSSKTRRRVRMGSALLLTLILLFTAVMPGLAKGREIKISYFYSFIHTDPLLTTVQPGETFTIYDEFGGCGTVYHDIAQVEVDKTGRIRAYNHDCLSGDGPGTYGPWVRKGCSTAEEFGYVVQACVIDDEDEDN